ncbi:phage Gp37/Gp68 family protein [Polaromonas sp.]|uniref:phage Gp37/Gp68 family protein n=1 Tax=Polaromonas sp. TaxID=1869339 RepID=UPI00272F85AF|nr:phage Gp37/Gp68 family protein [Polaromonas sp.]MDP1886618.1 phage Gp37/Gp68 family protein [Polaromonas sp.]
MMLNSKIEWCDHTFNPWIGCTKVSVGTYGGCELCYAERSTPARVQGVVWGPGAPRRRTSVGNWVLPRCWNAQHQAFYNEHGRRQRVFCASLADVFDNEVDPQWRADLFALIRATPNLDWLLLTKRIGMVLPQLKEAGMHCNSTDRGDLAFWIMSWFDGRPPANVWLGATVVNQKEADRDIPKLLATPARVRFLSMEPLLGPVDLTMLNNPGPLHQRGAFINALRGGTYGLVPNTGERHRITHGPLESVDWVIAGGESGPRARPMSIQWARTLRDQCKAAGVPMLFKQWGEWAPALPRPAETPGRFAFGDYEHDPVAFSQTDRYPRQFTMFGARSVLERVGKKAAGRLLDGIEHNGFPA